MEPVNQIKIALGIMTAIITFSAALIQLRKNRNYLLNQMFAGFMIFIGLGFCTYTAYHLIFDNETQVITLNLLTNIFYSIGFSCLCITPVIIQYSEKDFKVKVVMLIVFSICIITGLGYLIWPVELDHELYETGVVSTKSTNDIFMHLYKIIIILYVLIQYIKFSKHSEGFMKKKMQFFSLSMVSVVVGIGFIILGGVFGSFEQYMKILGGIVLNIATIIVAYALLMKPPEENKAE